MENDILVSLEDLGYQGTILEDGALECAVTGGAASPEYSKLCAWIVSELRLYCKLEENVHATNSAGEAESFQLEMSGLLAELSCPYAVLVTGDISQRFLSKDDCLLLLTFLVSEVEASRMVLVNKPQRRAQQESGSPVFQELKAICLLLGMSKPPASISMFHFFSGIEKKLKEVISRVPSSHVGDPLMKKPLGPVHLEKIEAINQALVNDYDVRRKMLLKRLDVTVQSFGWSDRAKTRAEQLASVYQPLRSALSGQSRTSVSHLLAARQDFSRILQTSSGRTREKSACALNKVLMGRVPDRGGRPCEIEPPPPEMPSWQKRQDAPPGGHYGGGGGGGGRGYEQHSQGGRGGGCDRGGRGGGARGGYHHQGGGGGGGRGSYGGGSNQGHFQDSGYHSGGGHHDGYHQDGGWHHERGGGRGFRGGRGRGRGGGGGGGGGWGGRGGQSLNQGGQFEQFFQYGGQQYSQAGFSQPRYYSS